MVPEPSEVEPGWKNGSRGAEMVDGGRATVAVETEPAMSDQIVNASTALIAAMVRLSLCRRTIAAARRGSGAD